MGNLGTTLARKPRNLDASSDTEKYLAGYDSSYSFQLYSSTLPMAPPDLDIDPAWSAVLNYANEQHLQFGKTLFSLMAL